MIKKRNSEHYRGLDELYSLANKIEKALSIPQADPRMHVRNSYEGLVETLETVLMHSKSVMFDRHLGKQERKDAEARVKRLQEELCWRQYEKDRRSAINTST